MGKPLTFCRNRRLVTVDHSHDTANPYFGEDETATQARLHILDKRLFGRERLDWLARPSIACMRSIIEARPEGIAT